MRRGFLYGLLALAWFVIVGWQAFEHQRMREAGRRGLANRAHDLSAALSVVIRSQGRAAVVPKPRIEAALSELVDSTELESVTLLNGSGEVAASAGQPMRVDIQSLLQKHEQWSRDRASFANLVALGPGAEREPAILLLDGPRDEGRRGPHGGPGRFLEQVTPEQFLHFDALLDEDKRRALLDMMNGKPLAPEQVDAILGFFSTGETAGPRAETLRRALTGRPLTFDILRDVLMMAGAPEHGPGSGFDPPPGPPPWMNRKDYDRLIEERGVHWFLVTIPTAALHAEMARDLQLRGIVAGIALLACLALGMAWRAFDRSSQLEVQLVRAEEATRRLQELNVTAAGLVHETKNPLNLIRGLAQMIGREENVPSPVRNTAVKITEEADRVTGRLNQFLDYARPVQPHPKPLDLALLVKGVFDILAFDREEKAVSLVLSGPPLSVNADEDMLRQLLFNLILNAIQAVPAGGGVEVHMARDDNRIASVEIRDNGPGIPDEVREEIFRPYFTTSEKGTGLGLAVVRRIALAHDWDVTCVPCQSGSVFRLSRIVLAQEPTRND